MDELQLTWDGNKLCIWGISSNPDEQFTPNERLKKYFRDIYGSEELTTQILDIDIPSENATIIPSKGLSLIYGQYSSSEKHTIRRFSVACISIPFHILRDNFLLSEKMSGFSFGDSYTGFKDLVKFGYSLVIRQRFTPYIDNQKGFFLLNLDNIEDFHLFKDLCEILPLSIKADAKQKSEEAVHSFLKYFVDTMVRESLQDLKLGVANTKVDHWIHSLLDRKVSVDNELIKNITEWVSSRNLLRMHEYSILFKLEEPRDLNNTWRLFFAVQAKNDPSLIIGLDELWLNKKKLAIPNYKIFLLQELAMAAQCSKVIESALLKPNPSETFLTEELALSFIKQDSFLLKDFGFIVQIPKVTAAKLSSLRVFMNFKKPKTITMKSTSSLSESLFDFDYEVAIGDDITLSKEDFHKLSKLKSGLVNIDGKWVEINKEDVNKILSFIEKKNQLSLSDVIYANTSGEIDFNIEIKSFPEQFGKSFLNKESLVLEEIPQNFSGELREYQKEGYSWMILLRKMGFGGILADDMGLGKTIQAISYLLYLQKESTEKATLIVAPTSVIGNWEKEFLKFAPSINWYIHHGNTREKKEFKKQIKDKDVVITSYGTLRNDQDLFLSIEWDTIIIDEAQNIKNPYTKQTLSITKLSAKQKLCLTGTPIENRLSELWSLMNFSNSGLLSSWEVFKKKFAEPIELNSDTEKTHKLRKVISPFILRRLKTDKKIISDLPEKTEIKEYCTLTEEQVTLYQAILDESMNKMKEGSENRRAHILATILKLKQVCNHPTNFLKDTTTKMFGRSGKMERLCGMVEVIIENNEKCLIFTQFKEMGDIIKKVLEDYFAEPVFFLHGQVSRKERERLIDIFQTKDKPRIFILSLKAGGTGINLTAATQVIHFDRWWNPAVENQATDRVFRIGQKRNVFIYKYITLGTIEEKIDEMLEQKNKLSGDVLAQGEKALTELTNDELIDLFSLRKEAFS